MASEREARFVEGRRVGLTRVALRMSFDNS
jgi:hypothetical protein